MRVQTWLWVATALGSAVGGVARHALTEAVGRVTTSAFPWGTWFVNVSGSAAFGAVMAMVAAGWPGTWSPTARQAAMTGVLGGFTTFSTFSAQTLTLLEQGQWAMAGAYAMLSVVLGVGSCWLAFVGVQAAMR